MSALSSVRISRFCFFAALCIFIPVTKFNAQDRRIVQEPVMPSHVCATLSPDNSSLQAALDHCPAGQAVRLSAATNEHVFLSGPLQIPSGVFLWIDHDATLMAVNDPKAYDRGNHTCGTIDAYGNGCLPFISIHHSDGGGIMGDGTIDGQGGVIMQGARESWWQLARRAQALEGKQNIPRLLEIDESSNITLYRVALHNSPNFHVAMNQVRGITIWGVTIDSPADARNTDGIDPSAAQDVTIAHTYIRTGDDDIAIKAGKSGMTAHLSILDNHFYSGHGMSIGSETLSGVQDIEVRNLTLDGTTSGLRIKSDASRGGVVSNVHYENVCMRNNRWPIDFDTHYDKHASGSEIPVYRNITLDHVSGQGGTLVFRGYDQKHALQITLNDVSFDQGVLWQIEQAELHIGTGGLSASPSILSATPVASPYSCDEHWVPFPSSRKDSIE